MSQMCKMSEIFKHVLFADVALMCRAAVEFSLHTSFYMCD